MGLVVLVVCLFTVCFVWWVLIVLYCTVLCVYEFGVDACFHLLLVVWFVYGVFVLVGCF